MKLSKLIINYHIVIVLILLLLLTLPYLNSGYLLHGDFASVFLVDNESTYYLKDFFYTWNSNSYAGYPASYYTLLRLPFYIVHDFIKLTGLPYYSLILVVQFMRYSFFYLLLKRMGISKLTNVPVSIIYILSMFFLDRMGPFYIYFSSAFVPIYFLTLYDCVTPKVLRLSNLLLLLLVIWFLLVSMHITLLVFYLTFPFLLYLLVIKKNLLIKNVLAVIMGVLLVFSYIWLPILFTFIKDESTPMASVRTVLNDTIYYYSSNSLLYNTFFGYGVSYPSVVDINFIQYLLAISLIPLIYISLTYKHNLHTAISIRDVQFLRLTSLIFLFLSTITLVQRAIPVLKEYLFGFSYIKDSTYFLFPYIFITLLMFGLLYDYLVLSKSKFYLYPWYLVLVFLVVHSVAISNLTTLKTSYIPEDYKKLTSYIRKDGRILVFPYGWVTSPKWAEQAKILSGFYQVYLSNFETITKSPVEGAPPLTQEKLNVLAECIPAKCRNFQSLLDDFNVSHIVNFTDNNNYGDIPNSYYAALLGILVDSGIVTKLYDGDYYEVYLNTTDSKKLNYPVVESKPYKYTISVGESTAPVIFKESYSDSWFLYSSSSYSHCGNSGLIDFIFCNLRNFYEEITFIWRTPLKAEHSVYAGYGNYWVVDNTEITNSNLITIYYLPQAYYFLGVNISIVSVLTLLLLSLFLNRTKGN